MSVKTTMGAMVLGVALGAAVTTVFPVPIPSRSVRKAKRYLKKML